MSQYIVCVNLDGNVSAYIEPQLNAKIKYEVGIAEIIMDKRDFLKEKPFIKGALYLYTSSPVNYLGYVNFSISDRFSIISIQNEIKDLVDKFNKQEFTNTNNYLQFPLFYYDEGIKKLVIDCLNNFKFKVSDNLIDEYGIKKYIWNEKLDIKETFPIEKNIFHICSDIIDNQIIGNNRKQILTTITVCEKNNNLVHLKFVHPYYIKLLKTEFESINISFCDYNFKQFKISHPAYIKLHFRAIR